MAGGCARREKGNSYTLLAIMLPGYVILTQLVKTWFYRRFGDRRMTVTL
jgi:hypothetical protein